MNNEWFVFRDGKEQGPFTTQQLKEMASNGKIVGDDLIRRNDMKSPTKASKIKGLFPEVLRVEQVIPVEKLAPEKPTPQPKPNKKPLMIVGAIAGGFVLLCCGLCGFSSILSVITQRNSSREMAEAESLWQSGKKAEAVATYRERRKSGLVDRPMVYGRLIDFEYESRRERRRQAIGGGGGW